MSEEIGADPHRSLHARRQEHWYGRLMTLADGVFAIAITLLTLDIGEPANWAGDFASLWARLAPQLDAYGTSFLVISVFWLAHRRFMAQIERVDAPLTVLTLLLLGLVALLPPATRMMSHSGAKPVAQATYGVLLVAIGVSLGAIWAYASFIARTVAEAVPMRLRAFLLVLIVATPPLFLWLTTLMPMQRHGLAPALLVALFLFGWRLRLLFGRRLGGRHHTA